MVSRCAYYFYHVAVSVFFNKSSYNVKENNALVQPVLVLSNPSSIDIAVQVVNTDISATGEQLGNMCNYLFYNILQEE